MSDMGPRGDGRLGWDCASLATPLRYSSGCHDGLACEAVRSTGWVKAAAVRVGCTSPHPLPQRVIPNASNAAVFTMQWFMCSSSSLSSGSRDLDLSDQSTTTSSPLMSSCPLPQNTSHRNGNRPLLVGTNRTLVVSPGLMSARTPKSRSLKPCSRSIDVISRTTGTPFLTVMTSGLYSNFLAVMWITCSAAECVGRGVSANPPPISATITTVGTTALRAMIQSSPMPPAAGAAPVLPAPPEPGAAANWAVNGNSVSEYGASVAFDCTVRKPRPL